THVPSGEAGAAPALADAPALLVSAGFGVRNLLGALVAARVDPVRLDVGQAVAFLLHHPKADLALDVLFMSPHGCRSLLVLARGHAGAWASRSPSTQVPNQPRVSRQRDTCVRSHAYGDRFSAGGDPRGV